VCAAPEPPPPPLAVHASEEAVDWSRRAVCYRATGQQGRLCGWATPPSGLLKPASDPSGLAKPHCHPSEGC
jgi:hypothetical protein